MEQNTGAKRPSPNRLARTSLFLSIFAIFSWFYPPDSDHTRSFCGFERMVFPGKSTILPVPELLDLLLESSASC